MTEAGRRHEEVKRFGFLLLPHFAMLAFTAAVEPLRAANSLSGRRLYDWRAIAAGGGAMVGSNGIALQAQGDIEDRTHFDSVVVCGGLGAHRFDDKGAIAWLRRHARQGARIGAISDGTHVLAAAGLLEGYACTIHWRCQASLEEMHPQLEVHSALYCLDRSRFTCAGGTASLDMMLHLIECDHGHGLALEVAEQCLHERIRGLDAEQRMDLRRRLGVGHPKLLEAVRCMEANLEEPLSTAELASLSEISVRQLERLCQRYLGCTPRAHYVELRLRRAHWLLTHSSLSVTEVGLACGFVSASHFAKRYRERFSQSPQRTRMGVRPEPPGLEAGQPGR
ncbi:MAG: GlxA family transcriptional regulator [Rhodospirillales bacterium]|nr:GlxA family transcriptional regulator [Rhodospirillales bacterium]